jgi:hypothetical protein
MTIILDGGPMDGEEWAIVELSPSFKIQIIPDYPYCFNYEEGQPVTVRRSVARYMRVRYPDGRIGYRFDGMD